MKKKKDKKPRERKGPTLAQRLAAWYSQWKVQGYAGLRLYASLIIACGAIIGAVAGLRAMETRVLSGEISPAPMNVVLTFDNLPEWVPDDLGTDLATQLLPASPNYNDPRLVYEVCERAQKSPWIAKVEVVTKRLTGVARKDPLTGKISRDGEVVLRAQYRQPVARVQAGDGSWVFVDAEGVRLPDDVPAFRGLVRAGPQVVERWYMPNSPTPPDAKPVHYIAVQGVSTPPPAVGQKWDADDVVDALRLATRLRSYPWYEQITLIDVRNYEGKLDGNGSWLQIVAKGQQGNTDIQFGHFPLPHGDWEITPEEKLSFLDSFIRKHNGLVKGRIDLRPANPLVQYDQ